LSLRILGIGGSNLSFLYAILELISNVDYVLDPATSSSAAKCFEVIFRLMQLGKETPPILLSHQFWQSQVMRYLGMRSPTNPSILHDISSSFASDRGDDLNLSRRNNDVLHSISWLLKGLSLEIFALAGGGRDSKMGNTIPGQSLIALFGILFSQPGLLQMALTNLPLGQSNNDFLQHPLNSLTPTQDALKASSIPLQGSIDVCARFEVVDLLKLPACFGADQESAKEESIKWAMAWNSYVARACACSHISQAWSDLCRTATIVSHAMETSGARRVFVNTRVISDMLCSILLRLNTSDTLDQLGHYGVLHEDQGFMSGGTIEPECALPLSAAALCLTDILHRDLLDNTSDYMITEEDVSRICALLDGSILSCESGSNLPSNDERAKRLKCALSLMHAFCEG
jgi:hypothetical protein